MWRITSPWLECPGRTFIYSFPSLKVPSWLTNCYSSIVSLTFFFQWSLNWIDFFSLGCVITVAFLVLSLVRIFCFAYASNFLFINPGTCSAYCSQIAISSYAFWFFSPRGRELFNWSHACSQRYFICNFWSGCCSHSFFVWHGKHFFFWGWGWCAFSHKSVLATSVLFFSLFAVHSRQTWVWYDDILYI